MRNAGQPARTIAGTAQGRTCPGRPGGDTPPESPEHAEVGQPADAKPAHPEDAVAGATWGLIARLDGTINDPMSCKGTQKKAPGTPVSGVFNLGLACVCSLGDARRPAQMRGPIRGGGPRLLWSRTRCRCAIGVRCRWRGAGARFRRRWAWSSLRDCRGRT